MAKQQFNTFRELLHGAICNRTQAQFANETGISAEHISRMLNAKTIHRPNKQTLMKIAANAKNGITYQDLLDALNEEDENYKPPTLSDIQRNHSNRIAAYEFKQNFEEVAEDVFTRLTAKLKANLALPAILPDLTFLLDNTVKAHREQYPNDPQISYDITDEMPYIGTKKPNASLITTVIFSIADWTTTACCYVLLYMNAAQAENQPEELRMVTGIGETVNDIFEIHGLPAFLNRELRTWEKEHPNEDSTDKLDEICKRKLCIKTEQVNRFIENTKTSAKNLLKMLFGDNIKFTTTLLGFGFYLDAIPEKFGTFIKKHENALLSAYEDEPEIWEKLKKRIKDILENQPESEWTASLKDLFSEKETVIDNESYETGWPAAITNIMSAETGFPFGYHKYAEHPEKYPELNYAKEDCILIEDKQIQEYDLKRETLLNIVCAYCRELGIKNFGDLVYTTEKKTLKKINQYAIKKKPDDISEICEDGAAEEDPHLIPFEKNGPRPKSCGIYLTKLKDERYQNCLYIPRSDIWVARHKEWSDFIAEISLTPIHAENTSEAPNLAE